MGYLSSDLRNLGFEPTGEESPFDDNGTLWTNGYETVCDETAIVIDHLTDTTTREKGYDPDKVYRYRSGKVKLPGGYISSYDL